MTNRRTRFGLSSGSVSAAWGIGRSGGCAQDDAAALGMFVADLLQNAVATFLL